MFRMMTKRSDDNKFQWRETSELIWSEIFDTLSKVTGGNIIPNVFTALFGVWCLPLTLSSANQDLPAVTTLLARRLILLKWRYAAGSERRFIVIKLAKKYVDLVWCCHHFDKTWDSFLSYINSTRCQISLGWALQWFAFRWFIIYHLAFGALYPLL